MMNIERLHNAVSSVAPIDGVSIGLPDDKSTWGIAFRPDATDQQKSAAMAVLAAYDPSAPTQEDYEAAITGHIDAVAKSRGYDSALSCATYATDPIFSAEAQAFVVWRGAVWSYAYSELSKVKAQQRPQPSIDAFILELPSIKWPGG